MNIWILLSLALLALLCFTVFAPAQWRTFILKENKFWLKHHLMPESFVEKMVQIETGKWLKAFIVIDLFFIIFIAFTDT